MKQISRALLIFVLCLIFSLSVFSGASAYETNYEVIRGNNIKLIITIPETVRAKAGSIKFVYDELKFSSGDWLLENVTMKRYDADKKIGVFTFEKDYLLSGNVFEMELSANENTPLGTYKIAYSVVLRNAEGSVTTINGNYAITVINKPISVTGVALDRETISIGTGDGDFTLTATLFPETATNKNVIWSSSDKAVATVENGVVMPYAKGVTTITVTSMDGGFSASCVVIVNCSHLNKTNIFAEASTCIKHGHTAYTICNDCKEIVAGSDKELPFSDHVGGEATCIKKAVCEVCHKQYGDFAVHKYIENARQDCLKTAATCASKAIYYKSCSVCGNKSKETFETGDCDYTNHIGETYLKNQRTSTCYEEGYTGDVYCKTCGREISKGHSIEKIAHTGGEATCIKRGTCSICGSEYGNIDSSNHKHTEVRSAKMPTCCENGYAGDVWCADCNTKMKVGNIISANGNHKDVDGKWESDGTKHWHTCYFGTKFDIDAHMVGEWIIDVPATSSSEGAKHKECVVCCKIIETAVIEKGGLYGDVNGDGIINTNDAIAILRYNAKIETLTDSQLATANVDSNKSVDSNDAILILKYDAKAIDKFPIE